MKVTFRSRGDDIGRMTRLFGGRVKFFGWTFGKWGFGFIRWTGPARLGAADVERHE